MRITLVFLTLLFSTVISRGNVDSSGLRMSLLTVGPGHEELYEPFGHTGIRIVDSFNGTDLVYSYGSFNYSEPNFELKFMRGKLLYYMSASSFKSFMAEYDYTGRKVEEQLLLLDQEKKKEIFEFLQYNLLPENKYYKYDFLFDNCATRVRDVFPSSFGSEFNFGPTLPEGKKLSFRQVINQYLYVEHFARFGINILLGADVDRAMTDKDAMFLPDFLRDGLANAELYGQPIAGPVILLLDGSHPVPAGVNGAFLLCLIVMILTLMGYLIPQLNWLGTLMRFLVLFITGLLGCIIVFMWFGTDHQACQNNYNLLWALPTSLMLLLKRKGADKYAVIAMILLLISLGLHVLGIQRLPMFELWPWLVSLLVIYGAIYRRSKVQA